MFRVTEVVKHLLIINILAFVGVGILKADLSTVALHYPAFDGFKPYQIITHMFVHADLNHLFFNMLGLFFFGPHVEARLGHKRFLIFYLACGFGAMILSLLIYYYQISILGKPMYPLSLGASGAIYGVLAAFATLYPNQRIFLLFPPIPIKAKYLIIAYLAISLFSGIQDIRAVAGQGSGIGHFAHLGGLVVGFFLIYYWRNIKRTL